MGYPTSPANFPALASLRVPDYHPSLWLNSHPTTNSSPALLMLWVRLHNLEGEPDPTLPPPTAQFAMKLTTRITSPSLSITFTLRPILTQALPTKSARTSSPMLVQGDSSRPYTPLPAPHTTRSSLRPQHKTTDHTGLI